MGKPLVRFCEGLECNFGMDEILWHRRETRRQTENTNIGLQHRESPVYSTGGLIRSSRGVAAKSLRCKGQDFRPARLDGRAKE